MQDFVHQQYHTLHSLKLTNSKFFFPEIWCLGNYLFPFLFVKRHFLGGGKMWVFREGIVQQQAPFWIGWVNQVIGRFCQRMLSCKRIKSHLKIYVFLYAKRWMQIICVLISYNSNLGMKSWIVLFWAGDFFYPHRTLSGCKRRSFFEKQTGLLCQKKMAFQKYPTERWWQLKHQIFKNWAP